MENEKENKREAEAPESALRLGLVVMSSGWSRRFGRNKLLERLQEKPMISYVFNALSMVSLSYNSRGAMSESYSGLKEEKAAKEKDEKLKRTAAGESRAMSLDVPLVVTRFPEVRELGERYGFRVLMHNDPDQSDTIRHALSTEAAESWDGCMFLTGDQPMLSESSLHRLIVSFSEDPEKVYRLSYGGEAGNPVIFPKKYFDNLRNLTGDHGGGVLLRNGLIPAGGIILVSAEREFELWDVDTEEAVRKMEQMLRLRY